MPSALFMLLVHLPAALLFSVNCPLLPTSTSPVVSRRLAVHPFLCAAEEAPAEEVAEVEEPTADDPKAAEKAEKQELKDKIAEIEKQLPKARGELAEALDAVKDSGENGYLLLAANFERFRQQARTELDSQKGYGRVGAVRALLPFAETFESLQQAAAVDGEEGEPIHKYYAGIYKQSQQLLESWNVEPFYAVENEAFNLKFHQTVERAVSDDVPAGHIISAVERGWKMGDDVVRLAKCAVSSGPAVEEVSEATADETGGAVEETTDAQAADPESA